jgi:hypothetical protein
VHNHSSAKKGVKRPDQALVLRQRRVGAFRGLRIVIIFERFKVGSDAAIG